MYHLFYGCCCIPYKLLSQEESFVSLHAHEGKQSIGTYMHNYVILWNCSYMYALILCIYL